MPVDYTPQAFDQYRPRNFVGLSLYEKYQLYPWVKTSLNSLDDESLLVLVLHYLMRFDMRITKAASKAEYPRGIVELFRFQAKRFLERENPIPDSDMHDAFLEIAESSEVILLTGRRGVCLHRKMLVPQELVDNAVLVSQHRME